MSFKYDDSWESHKQYYLPTVEKNIIMLWSMEENSLISQLKIWWFLFDLFETGCLLDYPFFKECYQLIVIDLSKQQKIDAEAKEQF